MWHTVWQSRWELLQPGFFFKVHPKRVLSHTLLLSCFCFNRIAERFQQKRTVTPSKQFSPNVPTKRGDHWTCHLPTINFPGTAVTFQGSESEPPDEAFDTLNPTDRSMQQKISGSRHISLANKFGGVGCRS